MIVSFGGTLGHVPYAHHDDTQNHLKTQVVLFGTLVAVNTPVAKHYIASRRMLEIPVSVTFDDCSKETAQDS